MTFLCFLALERAFRVFLCICDTSGVQFVAVCTLTGTLGHLLANDNRYEFSFSFIYFQCFHSQGFFQAQIVNAHKKPAYSCMSACWLLCLLCWCFVSRLSRCREAAWPSCCVERTAWWLLWNSSSITASSLRGSSRRLCLCGTLWVSVGPQRHLLLIRRTI